MRHKTLEELHRRNAYYVRRYGITADEVVEQYKYQKGTCAICRNEIRVSGTKIFHIDHDHKTGKVRGLLCFSCNRLMGRLDRKEYMLGDLACYVVEKGMWYEASVFHQPSKCSTK